MRLRRRHYDLLRALRDGPRTTQQLADAVGTSPVVADLRATELLPQYATSRDDVWTITDVGRDLLTGEAQPPRSPR